jgi:hypothetical protein
MNSHFAAYLQSEKKKQNIFKPALRLQTSNQRTVTQLSHLTIRQKRPKQKRPVSHLTFHACLPAGFTLHGSLLSPARKTEPERPGFTFDISRLPAGRFHLTWLPIKPSKKDRTGDDPVSHLTFHVTHLKLPLNIFLWPSLKTI